MSQSTPKMDPKSQSQTQSDIQPYSMHVSSRYLELTKRKLESTRLPREVHLSEQRRWDLGTPKALLEPLLDYWIEEYDWRTQETHYNASLPQYRTMVSIPSRSFQRSVEAVDTQAADDALRIHFVHKRSKHNNAVPLLFCHSWPASFIEVEKIIDALTDPHSLPSFGAGAQQAFHVVAPSIPGFGFSDASGAEDFGLGQTAEVFDGLMKKLGYDKYLAHGTEWGFRICRTLALNHSQHCLAVHTTNPTFEKPSFKYNKLAWLKYRIACWTKATISLLSFGYMPAEVQKRASSQSDEDACSAGTKLAPLYALRPQTLAFSLCDSPVGLLAGILDFIHTRSPSMSPVTSRSRSPFLSPIELERQESVANAEQEIHSGSTERPTYPFSPRGSDFNVLSYTWSPTEILNWTMLHWLPGPEAGLRWLRRATVDMSPTSTLSRTYCSVPLGISSFQARTGDEHATPVMWGHASWNIAWVKRHQRSAAVSPAWEAPDLLVLDMRECFGTFLSMGTVNLPVQES